MTHYLAIFGRTPKLSRLELQATAPAFGLTVGEAFGDELLMVSAEKPLKQTVLFELQDILGGTLQIVEVVGETSQRQDIVTLLRQSVMEQAAPEGKLTLGMNTWSAYGKPHPAFRLARDLKGQLTELGRSIRMVTPPAPYNYLSTAQIIHNKLLQENKQAFNLVAVWTKRGWIVGITRTVQDIASYSKRDFGIPKPDAVSGMLPPKLAQTMINVGLGANRQRAVYDPFCGNGRILLEGSLMGLDVYGSDIAEKQVEASQINLEWLTKEYTLEARTQKVWQADATAGPGQKIGEKFVIVTEPYLGKPLRNALPGPELRSWLGELEPIYLKFFTHWAKAAEKPDQFLVVFPRAKTSGGATIGTYELLVDRLGKMGYTSNILFCYSRPDSLVQRDLVLLTLIK